MELVYDALARASVSVSIRIRIRSSYQFCAHHSGQPRAFCAVQYAEPSSSFRRHATRSPCTYTNACNACPSKRISPSQEEAVFERLVTYNYTEKVPIFLQAQIQDANRFTMKETLTFNWVTRSLTIESRNESSRPMIKYSERVICNEGSLSSRNSEYCTSPILSLGSTI
jgi:hypothetical protein